MGVRGLRKFLSTRLQHTPYPLPNGATLVIDGDGWLFHLYETCRDFLPELGGIFVEFESHITRQIQFLRSCGVKLIVFLDGHQKQVTQETLDCGDQPVERFYSYQEQLKQKTLDSRRDQRLDQWMLFYSYCEEGLKNTSKLDFPIPPLCKEQLIATLNMNSVPFHVCDGEADGEIALYVQQHNREHTNELFFAYGRDSDFILMKDCPYIEFGDISRCHGCTKPDTLSSTAGSFSAEVDVSESNQIPSQLGGELCLSTVRAVWRRAEVSKKLGVSEAQLVDWAILIGNDYTGEVLRENAYMKCGRCKQGFSYEVLEQLLETVVTDFRDEPLRSAQSGRAAMHPVVDTVESSSTPSPSPPSPVNTFASGVFDNVQIAIDLSRAIYDLLPLDGFVVANSIAGDVEGETEDDNDDEGALVGPEILVLMANSYFDSSMQAYAYLVANNSRAADQPLLGIGEHAIAFLRYRYLCLASDDAFSDWNERFMVSASHVQAFDDMLRVIDLRAAYKTNPVQDHAGPADATRKGSITSAINPSDAVDEEVDVFESLGFSKENRSNLRPKWDHVVAAFLYQKACRSVVRFIDSELIHRAYVSPLSYFDGEVFHGLLAGRVSVEQEQILRAEFEASLSASHTPVKSPVKAHVEVSEKVTEKGSVNLTAKVPVSARARKHTLKTVEGGENANLAEDVLPIESYRDEILDRIENNRVTIIHGETGCGKSSCVPRFILEDCMKKQRVCDIFVSQPRRVGVTSLLHRLRPTLGDLVGMRMGHGVKDETSNTCIRFVTTGYLVKYIAHKPKNFSSCTHVIIDEVHERSLDGDLVCLLIKQLLR
jgi:hypothetical protein